MKVLYILQGGLFHHPEYGYWSTLASNRLRALVPSRHFNENIQTVVATKPEEIRAGLESRPDICLIGKQFDAGYENWVDCIPKTTTIIVDVCDPRLEEQHYVGFLGDLVERDNILFTCSSDKLGEYVAEVLGGGVAVRVIEDPFEFATSTVQATPRTAAPNLLWFGHPGNAEPLEHLARDVEGFDIQIISGLTENIQQLLMDPHARNSVSFTPWSLKAMDNALRYTNRIVVSPVGVTASGNSVPNYKSTNRIVQSLAAGHIAISEGNVGDLGRYVIQTESVAAELWSESWRKFYTPALLQEGMEYVHKHYSPQAIAKQWEGVFYEIVNG